MGYVRCLKHVLPIMQKQGRGRVVNLIGNDGVKPSYWEIAPGAANAAGQNLTLALAAQYGKDNISFVAVNPGPVRTERWAGLVDAMARDMKIAREEADTLAPRSILDSGLPPTTNRGWTHAPPSRPCCRRSSKMSRCR
jgi:3-oxoacyl-[acyl-carrier protein] reductase